MSPFEIQQLWKLANGEQIERPAKRRLVARGYVRGNKPAPTAIATMVEHAPKSEWSPPESYGKFDHTALSVGVFVPRIVS